MGRIRLLHWYWQRDAGGIDRVVKDLAREQARNPGLDVAIATGRVAPVPRGRETRGVPSHVLGFRHGWDFTRLPRVRRLLRLTDVLHMHIYNPVVDCAARLEKLPVIYTDHGSDHARNPRNLFMVWFLQRRFVRSRPVIVTTNSLYRRRLQSGFYGLPEERIRLVYNGVDFTRIRGPERPGALRGALGLGDDEFVVGTVAVFQPRKRLPLLLEIFRDFLAARPGAKARLLIVGDGVGAAAVHRHAGELGIAGRTLFTGYRSDARELVGIMDAFLLPTKGEPFGLAAVEALALGRPTIVFADGGGLTEIVRDADTGYVVQDAAEAVRRLVALHDDPSAGRALGEAAQRDVVARFEISRMEQELYPCYGEAVGADI